MTPRSVVLDTVTGDDRPAALSPCGQYCFRSRLQIRPGAGTVTFIQLRPAVDALDHCPDRTHIHHLADRWGFATADVVYLFARLTDDTSPLDSTHDSIGQGNDFWILDSLRRSHLVLCTWGDDCLCAAREARVLSLIRMTGKPPCALGMTAQGKPIPVWRPNLQALPVRMNADVLCVPDAACGLKRQR